MDRLNFEHVPDVQYQSGVKHSFDAFHFVYAVFSEHGFKVFVLDFSDAVLCRNGAAETDYFFCDKCR